MFMEAIKTYAESLALICSSSVLALSTPIDICTSFCLALEQYINNTRKCLLIVFWLTLMWFSFRHLCFFGKDSDAGRHWRQEEKGMTDDEMAGWHHWLDGHESQWTPGVGDGQGGLVCCDSWGHEESDTTERLNWTELIDTKMNSKWWIFMRSGPTIKNVLTQHVEILTLEGPKQILINFL